MNEVALDGARTAPRHGGTVGIAAAFAAILAGGLAAWGTFGESNPDTGEYLVIVAIVGVATAVVFGWVVPRSLRRENGGTTALVLGVLGLLSVAVFWSGLPPVLATGAIVLGWAGPNAHRRAGLSRAALAIGALALVADIAVYIQDMAF